VAAALVESCQFVALRSPWGRLGSVLDTRKRLHRMRRRFKHFWSNSLSSPRRFSSNRPRFAFRALGELYTATLTAFVVQATTHHQTYPRRSPRADLPPKKMSNLDPMAPRSRQKRQLPEGRQ